MRAPLRSACQARREETEQRHGMMYRIGVTTPSGRSGRGRGIGDTVLQVQALG